MIFTIDDIDRVTNLLSMNRCNNYNDWVSAGMCLFNINKMYLLIWLKWSQKCEKYNNGDCGEKWKSFNKTKDGIKIGSLLLWAKMDNQEEYNLFMRNKKFGTPSGI